MTDPEARPHNPMQKEGCPSSFCETASAQLCPREVGALGSGKSDALDSQLLRSQCSERLARPPRPWSMVHLHTPRPATAFHPSNSFLSLLFFTPSPSLGSSHFPGLAQSPHHPLSVPLPDSLFLYLSPGPQAFCSVQPCPGPPQGTTSPVSPSLLPSFGPGPAHRA